jgi:hypothetical protein
MKYFILIFAIFGASSLSHADTLKCSDSAQTIKYQVDGDLWSLDFKGDKQAGNITTSSSPVMMAPDVEISKVSAGGSTIRYFVTKLGKKPKGNRELTPSYWVICEEQYAE